MVIGDPGSIVVNILIVKLGLPVKQSEAAFYPKNRHTVKLGGFIPVHCT